MRSIQSLPKDAFHALARKQFKALAAELGLQKGEYDLRTNKAGPAVLGETTLHTDKAMANRIHTLIGTSRAAPAA